MVNPENIATVSVLIADRKNKTIAYGFSTIRRPAFGGTGYS